MTAYDPLEPYRFSKRHRFVIQECAVLAVREVVGWLGNDYPQALTSNRVEVANRVQWRSVIAARHDPQVVAGLERHVAQHRQPWWDKSDLGEAIDSFVKAAAFRPLVLVARKCGAARRWCFLCPSCNRRCEYLFLPQTEAPPRSDSLSAPPIANWRCRKCWNLNYGSQHYGRSHILRRQLPPRRVLTKRRRLAGAERARERYRGRCQDEARAKPAADNAEGNGGGTDRSGD